MTETRFTGSLPANHERAIEQATADRRFAGWIDGEPVGGDRRFETADPAVDEPITTLPRGDSGTVDAAVAAACEAFGTWGEYTPTERSERILEWVRRLRDAADELALLESLDTGKPIANAAVEVEQALDFLAYYAHVIHGEQGAQIPTEADTHAYTRREPYGVAGLIVPWNYPLLLTAWKVGPALAAGNTVVLKPAETAPLSATLIAQLSADILPDGVFNVVHGYGDEAGAALTAHDGVDKLSFTGEDRTGERVMEAAAGGITPVTLELGGKSPLVVFPDADLDRAADIAAEGIFYNTGQSCDAFSRTLVHESIHDEFLEAFRTRAAAQTVGDPLDPETTMGPLASAQQREKFETYVELGRKSGASLVTGGGCVESDELTDGWFVEPTVFDGVDNGSRLAQEEVFGPVASVIEFADYEDAIGIANDVEFGLAAGVVTSDLSLAHRAAADIDAGSVWVNQYAAVVPGTPFGGYERSGIGREAAKETLAQYSQSKAVNVRLDDPEL